MAEKEARGQRDQVATFEEFSHEEKQYREDVWKEQQQQSVAYPTTAEPGFRGWLEGKPNPMLPEDPTPFPKQDMASASGTKLADMFPGAVPGKTYRVPDASLDSVPKRSSFTDRVAAYPKPDKGNVELICWR